jgi:hypothetical protein
MQQAQSSSLPANRAWWHEVSLPARVTLVWGIPIAVALAAWEAADRSLGPEHPLSVTRLALRLGCLLACGVTFAVAGLGTFRARRRTIRLREGLCPECGYDLRAAAHRCPECGSPCDARAGA